MKKNPVSNYIKESFEELHKVSWPTRQQAVKLTVIVLIFCAVVGVFLGLVDYGLSELHDFAVTKLAS
ncbi:preprotein translocase subunit SecE [Candidatus Gracilibacteria bacterium]|nr:preprotein translocase subunit SecE [Candidatus Gracilibacteria bacterium]